MTPLVKLDTRHPWLDPEHLYIDGHLTRPSGDVPLTVLNPANETVTAVAPAAVRADIDRAVGSARAALHQLGWADSTPGQRAQILRQLAELIDQNAEQLAALITAEMGSPCRFSRGPQVTHPAAIARFYAELGEFAERHDTDLFGAADRGWGYRVAQEPVGVVAAIVPWNMPLKTVMMKVAPALLAGCTIIIKPAPQTPLDALALAGLLEQAGAPPGVVNVVPCHNDVADYLAAHPGVDKVAFTGSTTTGLRIAHHCANSFRRLTLECGGKSAAIICADADLDAAVGSLPGLALANSGQICSNLTRLIVPRHLAAEVTERVVTLLRSLTIGDPRDPATDIGPLVSERQRDRVTGLLAGAAADGATLTAGAAAPDGPGWWVTPALVTDAPPTAEINQEEIFGPILSLIPYDSEPEAVRIANGTRYGLAAGIYTQDPEQASRLARQLQAGTIHINGAEPDTTAPLGGYKLSGIGRELGVAGLHHYLETKVIAGDG